MRAESARHIKRQFHLGEGLRKIRCWNRPHYHATLVTDDIGLISANDAIEAAAALWITEVSMCHGRSHNFSFDAGPVAYRAITRLGKRGTVTVAI